MAEVLCTRRIEGLRAERAAKGGKRGGGKRGGTKTTRILTMYN